VLSPSWVPLTHIYNAEAMANIPVSVLSPS
jgi:hypothetical protein